MSKFSHQHYTALAELLAGLTVSEVKTVGKYGGALTFPAYHAFALLDSLCDEFERDNPKFNKSLFLKACDFEPWDEVVMGVPLNKDGQPERRMYGEE